MKHLVGKNPTKKFKFCEADVVIKKLSVDQVFEIQNRSKTQTEGDEEAGMELLQFVITCAVEGASELTREEFRGFPVDELSKLSNEVLAFSGLGNVAATPASK